MLRHLRRLGMKRLYAAYTLALAALLSMMSLLGLFDRPDLSLLDRAFNLRGPQDPNPNVVVVAISQQDFELGAPRGLGRAA